MHRLLLLGLNHTTAPLEVREKLAFNASQSRTAVEAFRSAFPSAEVVLLSTCNRVELYVGRDDRESAPAVPQLIEFMAATHSLPPSVFDQHLYRKVDRDVVEHLFTVSASLDSMVLGETQILGQVREAYEAASQAGAAGPLLHPLFQRALAVGKQVMQETQIAQGRLSVASVAVDYARNIFDHFQDKVILCIGAGKMAALVLQHLVGLRPGRLMVCNRDPRKAQELAARFNGQAVAFEQLPEHLVAADIVVSSTGSTQPIITRAQFEALRRQRRYRPIFLIDIAVPRDVEAAVGQLENVYLYNLDDLQQVVSTTLSQRKDAIDAARAIIRRHVEEFAVWHRQRELGPLIDQLYQRFHAIAKEEVARTLSKFQNIDETEKAHLEDLARRLVNKFLHGPIRTLRSGEGAGVHSPATPYGHALEKLFGLGDGVSSTAGPGAAPGPQSPSSEPEGQRNGEAT